MGVCRYAPQVRLMQDHVDAMTPLDKDVLWDAPPILLTGKESMRVCMYLAKSIAFLSLEPELIHVGQASHPGYVVFLFCVLSEVATASLVLLGSWKSRVCIHPHQQCMRQPAAGCMHAFCFEWLASWLLQQNQILPAKSLRIVAKPASEVLSSAGMYLQLAGQVYPLGFDRTIVEIQATCLLAPKHTVLVPITLLLPDAVPIRTTLKVGVKGPLDTGKVGLAPGGRGVTPGVLVCLKSTSYITHSLMLNDA
jgi:hypothetical protein